MTFQIWSVPTGRTVITPAGDQQPRRAAIETTVVDPSMAPGTAKRVEYPHDGHDVAGARYVYDADGNLLHENTTSAPTHGQRHHPGRADGRRAARPRASRDGGTGGTGDAPPAGG